jgi:hypothetical protein
MLSVFVWAKRIKSERDKEITLLLLFSFALSLLFTDPIATMMLRLRRTLVRSVIVIINFEANYYCPCVPFLDVSTCRSYRALKNTNRTFPLLTFRSSGASCQR